MKQAAEALTDSPQGLTRARILLADDADATRKLSLLILEREGHEVTSEVDGVAAAERALAESFDLVLMDVRMPGVDGFEATRRIRAGEQESGRPRVPILALTAHAGGDFRTEATDCGMDGFLEKPVRRDDLVDAVRQWARRGSTPYAPVVSEDGDPPSQEVDVLIPDPDVADLVPEYLERRRQDARRCVQLARESDFDTIRRLGHNMKGSGRGYGVERVTRIGAAIEAAATESDADAVIQHANALSRYLRRVRVVDRS